MEPTKPISVIICTYNRADLLKDTLQSLCGQTADPQRYEIIVVDNNSTDETAAIAQSFPQLTNLRYVTETKQGLSHARNRGWQEAVGEYLAYLDDDIRVPDHWVETAINIIEQTKPAIFGGPVFPFYNKPKPKWYKDEYNLFAAFGPEPRTLADDEEFIGCNITFARPILERFGGFDPNLGMRGNVIAYGEESALMFHTRSEIPGACLYYHPDLYVHHLTRVEKMTWGWIIIQRFQSGRGIYRVYESHKEGSTLSKELGYVAQGIVISFWKFLVDSTYGALRRRKDRYQYPQNYIFERALRRISSMGKLYERGRTRLQEYRASKKAG